MGQAYEEINSTRVGMVRNQLKPEPAICKHVRIHATLQFFILIFIHSYCVHDDTQSVIILFIRIDIHFIPHNSFYTHLLL